MRHPSARPARTSMISTIGRLLCAGLTFGSLSMPADAQAPTYPSRMIQIIAPFPAGGSADFFARVVAEKLKSMTGLPVIVEPRPGAGGLIGTRTVIDSPPDGYMLLSNSVASILVSPNLVAPRPFDPFKDLAPITSLATVPALLVANPQLGIRTLPDLVKYARANPGKINIASSGIGTVAHLAAEKLKREAMIDIVHVPFQGAPPAVTSLIGGHTQLMFSDVPFFLAHVRAGKLVALAAGTAQRIPALPEVPTTAEVGYPNLTADNTYCLFAPANTPVEVIEKLNSLLLTALEDAEVQEAYSKHNAVAAGMKTADFKAFMRKQAERWVPLAMETAGKAKSHTSTKGHR